jgi:hypothetical protein
MRLTTSDPKHSTTWGWLLWELGYWSLRDKEFVEDIVHEFEITRGRLRLPVCWWHRWIMPPFLGMSPIEGGSVTLSGVSDGFIAALKRGGWVR